ncbi:Chaperone J-domain-containing protein [Venustampulla echinocandica]|uniref:Chaperone J-domain-containing protein n=1 Tax=Venustampulla echinocandica TaxID=2656787 RepID=A0A370TQJ5_9HELO|nr:Chaperone J-domain-containing protein [Venustampulla echinocandica]RDL37789.1 Chaperone J-domain-containing protein [Venustampulla echinocandica]
MPSATASGADAKGNGTAKNRDHNQGNQDRTYTLDQKAAVIRVRRCQPTAFYEILGLETVKTTVTDTEIKKAYRKMSLLTHPDKNGHEHADEAFKMVSRAFGVLGDKEKRTKYDKYGGDPDSRFGGGSAPQNPFSGFGQRASRGPGGAAGGGSMWEEEISPEEMFQRFFSGGMGGGGFGPFGGGGMFDNGPGFVFNLNGGPGVRVHQFGGARPRRRPRDPNAPEEPAPSLQSILTGILPLLLIFILPLLSSIFSDSDSSSRGPTMIFDGPEPPQTLARHSRNYKVEYWVNPVEVENFTPRNFQSLDQNADIQYVQELRIHCAQEEEARNRLVQEGQGWFFQDANKINKARSMEMRNCKRLSELGQRRS